MKTDMKKSELRKLAWREVAVSAQQLADGSDLPPNLSENDEEYVRNYLRVDVYDVLMKKGGS